ncbi:MAG: undecaprenyl-phosphate glucose phosphotransferase [Pseudobdellovibrionaceae bacterium]
MLKAHEKSFALLQKLIDLMLVAGCWWVCGFVRFTHFKSEPLDIFYFKATIPLIFLTYYFFSRSGLYKSHRLSNLWKENLAVLHANFFSVMSFVVLIYFVNESKLSRATVIAYFIFSTFIFWSYRYILRIGLRALRRQGRNLRHVVLVGYGQMIESYAAVIQEFPDAGIKLKAWIDSRGASKKLQISEFSGDLADARRKFRPDYFIIGYPAKDTQFLEDFLRTNYNDVVPLVVLPDLQYSFIGFQVEDLAGFPALIVNQPNFSSVDEVSKRAFDFVCSGLGLMLLSPLFLLIGVLVKLDSQGPIFFRQERVGLDGVKFKMWKFRTMSISAESESEWTVKNDPRRTALGRILRATSLDELPQLWNVFCGDMSLVGPRPEQPRFVEKFRSEIPAYMLRHKMKAGITGWAQVNGWRGDTSLEKRLECDLYYVRNWSLWFDLKIIVLTFWRGFVNRNAY